MAGLGRLSKFPPEILEHILDGLCLHHVHGLPEYVGAYEAPAEMGSFKGLAGLCRASKQLNQLTTWRLYHSLTSSITRSRWMLISRTLIERSDLAALVRHLHLENVAYTQGCKAPYEPEVVDYYAEQIKALGPDAGLHADSLTEDTALPNVMTQYDAAIALMPRLCPNLSTVVFTASASASAFRLCPPDSMPFLSDVQVAHWDTEGGYDLALLEPLFEAAPNIKLLRMLQARCSRPLEDYSMLEHLTDLHLLYCYIPGDHLANMLSSLCPNLRRLEYACGGPLYGNEQFGPKEAAAAVLEHTPDLQKFELDLMHWMDFDDVAEDEAREAKKTLEQRGVKCRFMVTCDKGSGKAICV
jgi:hypothetical protein